MEKTGGVLFSLFMGGVLFFALFKIYTHKEDQWAEAHPEHAAIVQIDDSLQAPSQSTSPELEHSQPPAKLPCRHS